MKKRILSSFDNFAGATAHSCFAIPVYTEKLSGRGSLEGHDPMEDLIAERSADPSVLKSREEAAFKGGRTYRARRRNGRLGVGAADDGGAAEARPRRENRARCPPLPTSSSRKMRSG